MSVEREAKLEVPDDYSLPVLDGVANGVVAVALPRQRLLAVYYDTCDLALARSGLTLRHRTGEDADRWTVKLAGSTSGAELVRREVTFSGPPEQVPPAAVDLVRVHTRGRPLVAVARVRTLRCRQQLHDAHDIDVAEVALDRVSAYAGTDRVVRFRELEVELTTQDGAAQDVLDAIVERLVEAGASKGTPLPKLVRALGPPAQSPPDVNVGDIDKRSSARDFVRHIIAGSVARLLEYDPLLRLDATVADVHAFRVATRRLRSDLRSFRPLLDREWVGALRSELSWLADVVGAVRDADVLDLRLRDQRAALPTTDAASADGLLGLLAEQRAAARTAMLVALRSPRYDALIGSLIDAAAQPQFASDADADVSARKVVRRLVRRSFKRLRNEVRKAGKHPADDALHRIRIVAKRTRYAADAAAHVIGKPAERFAAAVADVQTVLGDHHDSSVTEAWLRDAATSLQSSDPRSGVAAGMLIERHRRDREHLHEQWRRVWRRTSAPKLRSWL